MEPDFAHMLMGSERIRITQLLAAPDGWRLVRATRRAAGEPNPWEIEALPVLCWALTHRTTDDGVIDHGVEAVVCDDGMLLLPHGEIDDVLDFLAPGATFTPEQYHARLGDRGQRSDSHVSGGTRNGAR